jgi:hypothetical protein
MIVLPLGFIFSEKKLNTSYDSIGDAGEELYHFVSVVVPAVVTLMAPVAICWFLDLDNIL